MLWVNRSICFRVFWFGKTWNVPPNVCGFLCSQRCDFFQILWGDLTCISSQLFHFAKFIQRFWKVFWGNDLQLRKILILNILTSKTLSNEYVYKIIRLKVLPKEYFWKSRWKHIGNVLRLSWNYLACLDLLLPLGQMCHLETLFWQLTKPL